MVVQQLRTRPALTSRPSYTLRHTSCRHSKPFLHNLRHNISTFQLPLSSTDKDNKSDKPTNSPTLNEELTGDDVIRENFKFFKDKVLQTADLDSESRSIIESMTYEDITDDTDKVFSRLTEQYLGPLLETAGIQQDPVEFFLGVIKLVLGIQLVSLGMVFYGCELGLHYDFGEAARASLGLALGYLSRPLVKVELFLQPIYTRLLELFGQEEAYEVDVKSQDRLRALNNMGVVIAVVFFVPQFAFGWQQTESLQFVAPYFAGWFMFDLIVVFALLSYLGELL